MRLIKEVFQVNYNKVKKVFQGYYNEAKKSI